MKTLNVNGYSVAGNDFVAIAINLHDPEDAHYFTYVTHEDGNTPDMTAFDCAVTWTSPGD